MDRASGCGPEGRRFDSCQGHKEIARQKASFCVIGVSERFHSRQESNAEAIFVSKQKCEAMARQIFATAKI